MTSRYTIATVTGLGLVSALLAACATTSGPDAKLAADTQAPVLARAAVYRAIFAANGSAMGDKVATLCVGDGAGARLTDADASMMAALADDPRVKPASACDAGLTGARVIDRATGQGALLVGVDTADCRSATECRIVGGYYEGNVSAQRNVYRATLTDGMWEASLEAPGASS